MIRQAKEMRASRLPSSKAGRPGTGAAGRRLAGRLIGRVVSTDTIRFGGLAGIRAEYANQRRVDTLVGRKAL